MSRRKEENGGRMVLRDMDWHIPFRQVQGHTQSAGHVVRILSSVYE